MIPRDDPPSSEGSPWGFMILPDSSLVRVDVFGRTFFDFGGGRRFIRSGALTRKALLSSYPSRALRKIPCFPPSIDSLLPQQVCADVLSEWALCLRLPRAIDQLFAKPSPESCAPESARLLDGRSVVAWRPLLDGWTPFRSVQAEGLSQGS